MGKQPQGAISGGALAESSTDDVLAAALEAYVSVNADGRVVAWNPAAESTFGYSRGQACGQMVEELIIAHRSHAAHRAARAQMTRHAAAESPGQRLQLSARHADGHEFPIELTLTMTDGAEGPMFHTFAHDITVPNRAQRFAAAESAVSRGLAVADNSADAGERVVQALGTAMQWPVVELWLVDAARQRLTCAARFASRDVTDFIVDELEYGSCLAGTVCRDSTARWVADIATEAWCFRSQAAARYGLCTAVGVPISSGGTVLGAIVACGDHAEDPEDNLTALLSGVAAHVGQYLERRRAEELEVELARTKDEFLAVVTHELRNPLSAISGTAALLAEELDELSPAQQRGYLQTITRNADRLATMTDDLLDVARLESGQLAMRADDADLAPIIAESLRAAEAALTGKQLMVTTDVDPVLRLHADTERLRQVADNLLGNAIKYTPAGGTITITAHPTGDDTMTWSIADTGIGIPAAERPRVFRRFYRASSALEKGIPGTGLGLVISRAIVECHRGTITLAEHRGPGTTFLVVLPIEPPA